MKNLLIVVVLLIPILSQAQVRIFGENGSLRIFNLNDNFGTSIRCDKINYISTTQDGHIDIGYTTKVDRYLPSQIYSKNGVLYSSNSISCRDSIIKHSSIQTAFYNGVYWVYVPVTLSAQATLDFVSIASNQSEDLTVTVTGASLGDVVAIGIPDGSTSEGVIFGWVSSNNIVTIRFHNSSGGNHDPAAGIFKILVYK